jgi:hypothetical protein
VPTQTLPPNEGKRSGRKFWWVALGVGGGFAILGTVFWGAASAKQDEADNFDPRSPADIKTLRDIENQGDAFAGAGNLFFIVGVGLAAVSGFYLWKTRHASTAQTARLTPTVFPQGAGVTLTIGGAP